MREGGGWGGGANHLVGPPQFSAPAWKKDEAKEVDREERGGEGGEEERFLERHVVEDVLCGCTSAVCCRVRNYCEASREKKGGY